MQANAAETNRRAQSLATAFLASGTAELVVLNSSSTELVTHPIADMTVVDNVITITSTEQTIVTTGNADTILLKSDTAGTYTYTLTVGADINVTPVTMQQNAKSNITSLTFTVPAGAL
jgi:hypothetical protein